jgi:hypothetical protein
MNETRAGHGVILPCPWSFSSNQGHRMKPPQGVDESGCLSASPACPKIVVPFPWGKGAKTGNEREFQPSLRKMHGFLARSTPSKIIGLVAPRFLKFMVIVPIKDYDDS